MKPARWLYRVRQFWHALTARPKLQALTHVQTLLNPAQFALFTRLQLSEQAHAISVLKQIEEQGYDNSDLLIAGLLHDVGKARHPLYIWERVVIVLTHILFPRGFAAWGVGDPKGWRRPFVIAAQHAAWGAEMAAEAGTSDLALELIRRHQDELVKPVSEVDELLLVLQAVDDAS